MSIAGECFRDPNNSSGHRYQRVTTTGVMALPISLHVLASPKSAEIFKSKKINKKIVS